MADETLTDEEFWVDTATLSRQKI